jgi:hypothetical protein
MLPGHREPGMGQVELQRRDGLQRDSAGRNGTGSQRLRALTWASRKSRTRGGQNACFTRYGVAEMAGQRPLRWAGMSGL